MGAICSHTSAFTVSPIPRNCSLHPTVDDIAISGCEPCFFRAMRTEHHIELFRACMHHGNYIFSQHVAEFLQLSNLTCCIVADICSKHNASVVAGVVEAILKNAMSANCTDLVISTFSNVGAAPHIVATKRGSDYLRSHTTWRDLVTDH